MKKNYKAIEIKLKKSLENREIEFVKELCSNYPREDIYLEYGTDKLVANIRALDLVKFKITIQELIKKHQLKEKETPFSQIIKEIEKIGSYGIKGRKRIFIDYDKERKVKDRESKQRKRGIYFYTHGRRFKKKNNEAPPEFVNRIICGDSESILKKLPENCIDLVFTSPPYNFGLDYDMTEDGIDWKKYFDKLFRIFDECIRVLKYGGRIIINVQPLFSDYIPSHHIISKFFMDRGLIWKGEIVWEKHNYNCKYTAWGSWKSPSSPYLKYTWEFLEVFAKGTLQKRGEKEDIDITADEFKKWVVAEWSIAPERNMKKYGHPAMFPEELVHRVIKLFSYQNDIILDPFNGVGTTTVVARKWGRKYLGIDISEEYCQKAKQRIDETFL